MDDRIRLWERPVSKEIYLIAGWRQWADAGSASSALPQYLIDLVGAKKIGELEPKGFYLFQIPGTHHFLRPEVNLNEGYRQSMEPRLNEFFYAGNVDKGLVIFLGDEPHLNEDEYATLFFYVAEELGVKRGISLGGVYGEMPYDKEREVSCVYSHPHMKAELDNYAVRFSNYHGGTTIGAYMVHQAESRDMELIAFNAFVPAYDFSETAAAVQGVRIDNDYRAWYDLMRRVEHMFNLGLDLSDLEEQSEALTESMHQKIEELQAKAKTWHEGEEE